MADSAGSASMTGQAWHYDGPALDMDDQQFHKWTELLDKRMGLFISPERRSFLATGIKTRMRETGCNDSRQYYHRLTGPDAEAVEWSLLVDQLTVHETCFFRHDSSMKLVSELLIPEVLGSRDQFQAWSVGCATGEEAYSLAMLIDSAVRETDGGHRYGVTGTDISLPTLERAREGVYLSRRLKDIPMSMQAQYCVKASEKRFRIENALRKRVSFSQLNLRDLKSASMMEMDLVFCQNLLIYFDRERRVQMVNDLCEFVRPGGMLVIGPGELLDWQHSKMEKVQYADTLAYRRTD